MPSLFTDSEKAELSALIVDVADTWERDIVVYKNPQRVIIFSDEENYDQFSGNNQNLLTNPENSFVQHVIKARVYYEKRLKDELLNPYLGGQEDEAQLKIKVPESFVRIKVGPAGYEVMKDVKEVEFDNSRFVIDSPPRLHGLFTTQYYTYYLKLQK